MERYRKLVATVLTGLAAVIAGFVGHEVISAEVINSVAFIVASILVWRLPNAS